MNSCVRPDHIRVRERSGTDDGHALTALAERTASTANYFEYLLARPDQGPTPAQMPPANDTPQDLSTRTSGSGLGRSGVLLPAG